MKQGFVPDSISTDVHRESMNAGMKDMLNVMSKFLNMGMSLDDVIACSTWHPAREIRHEELGNSFGRTGCRCGCSAPRSRRLRLCGFSELRMKGDQKLVGELTLREGEVVWDLNGISSEDWDHAKVR